MDHSAPEVLPRSQHPSRQRLAILLAVLAVVPGMTLRIGGLHPSPLIAAACFGLAVVGAAFMLAWGAEVIQLDISAGLALALLALIAVLPEYAVDFVFTWKAGNDPSYAPDALANMTGGNQLLIGVGWSMVVFIAAYRVRGGAARQDARPPTRHRPLDHRCRASNGRTRSRSRSWCWRRCTGSPCR